jgi:hypothetical protein
MTTVPSYLFGLEAVHLVPADDSGTGLAVRGRQPAVSAKRMRRKRRGLRARDHRGSARGESKGEFQKVAAFHGSSLFAYASDAKRVSSRQDEYSMNPVFISSVPRERISTTHRRPGEDKKVARMERSEIRELSRPPMD